jgi:hypothetical protein
MVERGNHWTIGSLHGFDAMKQTRSMLQVREVA